jgi:hypothetical protein
MTTEDTELDVVDQEVEETQPNDVQEPELQENQEVEETQPEESTEEQSGDDVDPPAEEPQQDIFDNLSQDEIRRRVIEYEKVEERLNRLVSSTGRHQQQFGELRKEHERLLAQIKEREEQESKQAEVSGLSPYNRRSPQYDKWIQLQNRARNDQETLSRVEDPDARRQLEQVIVAKYTPEEQQMLQGYQSYLEEQQSRLFSNPEEYFQELLEQRLPSIIEQRMQAANEYTTVQQQTQEFFTKHKALVDNYGDELLNLIQSGIPADTAAELVDLRHRNEKLSKGVAESATQAATAKAQANALGRKATVQTSSQSVPLSDLTEGLDSGLNDSDYLDRLMARRSQNT